MCWCKKDVTPLLTYWSYVFLALTYRHMLMHNQLWWLKLTIPEPITDDVQTHAFNTLRLMQNDRHFPDDIFKWIFLIEDIWISLKISLKFVPNHANVRINNILALVQIMAWHRPGAKLLSEPMMVKLLTHICVTRVKICHMNTSCIKHQSLVLSSVCLRWSTFSELS